MATEAPHPNPNTGFSSSTRTFHSLRPALPLPPPQQPISAASFALSHLRADGEYRSSNTAIIDSATGRRLSFSDFLNQVCSLAASLRWLSKGSVAFVLAPNSPQVPVLYFALLSIGVILSPANPLGTPVDISRQVHLSRPNVFFATTDTAHKLPSNLSIPVFLLHTEHFDNEMLAGSFSGDLPDSRIMQSDTAAILYSSGTTGHVKGVVLSHRNLIANIALFLCFPEHRRCPHVNLVPVPLFHVLGFSKCLAMVALGETMVLLERFDLGKALKAVADYRVTSLPAAPPVIAAMARDVAATNFDLGSLEEVVYGGGPLADKYVAMFEAKFPSVKLLPVSSTHCMQMQ